MQAQLLPRRNGSQGETNAAHPRACTDSGSPHQKLAGRCRQQSRQVQVDADEVHAKGHLRVEAHTLDGPHPESTSDQDVVHRSAVEVVVETVLVRSLGQNHKTVPEQPDQVSGRPLHLADCGKRAAEE
jgi:hypothetical protein